MTAAALVVVGYRPGGPIDLAVGAAVLPFVLIAVAGLAWPPVGAPGGPFALALALGTGAALLLVPSIVGVGEQLAGGGPQTLLPSWEAIYPWALALAATAVFAGIGLARRLRPGAPRRRRLAIGTILGLAATLVTAGVFGMAAAANELALAERPATTSRYGPIDPTGEPPGCTDQLVVPSSTTLQGRLSGEVDRASIGQGRVDGTRVGDDFRWQGFASSEATLGRYGAATLGYVAWTALPREAWQPAAPFAVEGLDLDRRFVETALTPERRAVAQDLGLVLIGGATARHCRVATDGAIVSEALPITPWIVGLHDIDRWRGEIDYYVFLDGAVGAANGSVNGEAFVLDRPGLLGTFDFELAFLDRGHRLAVIPPR